MSKSLARPTLAGVGLGDHARSSASRRKGAFQVMGGTGGFDSLAWDGLFSIFVTVGFIVLAWILLQEVRFDRIFRHPMSPRARVLQMLIAVIVGHSAARFVLDYWQWAGYIRWLFTT